MNAFNDYSHGFLQLNQVKMNDFNDCAYHFLQLIQVKMNTFNDVCFISCNSVNVD